MLINQAYYAQYYAFNIMIMFSKNLLTALLEIVTALLEYFDLVAAKYV